MLGFQLIPATFLPTFQNVVQLWLVGGGVLGMHIFSLENKSMHVEPIYTVQFVGKNLNICYLTCTLYT